MLSYLQELGVDLELRHRASLCDSGLLPLLHALEEVGDCPWDDALLLVHDVDIEARAHGVRLPRARLCDETNTHTNTHTHTHTHTHIYTHTQTHINTHTHTNTHTHPHTHSHTVTHCDCT